MQLRLHKRFTASLFFVIIFLGQSGFLFSQNTPCSALNLSANMPDFQTYSTNGLSNSGVENPSCGGTPGNDIWFQVTVSNSGYLNIVTLAGTLTNAAMAIYTGNCNNLTEFACTESDNCGNSIMPIWDMGFLTPGTTLFVRIWRENGSNGTFDIKITDAPSIAPPLNLQDVGSAFTLSPSCVQLTTESTSQTGCAWDPNLVDFSQPFQNNVILNFGDQNGNGADGICMVYQNDPAGLSSCGNLGGQIGAGTIQNSFIIEFDTWDNGGGFSDIPNDHVSVDINGDINNAINGPFDLGNIEDGADHEVLFTWDPVTMLYEIYFDGNLSLSGNYDIINNCFGGVTNVWCGFTASTGGATNNQIVCSVPPENFPSGDQSVVEIAICEGDSYFAGGGFQTTSGAYSDIFSAYNGCDSIVTTQLTVNPNALTILDETICEGDCFFIAGTPFCSTGTHEVVLTNYQNCDSTIQLNLTVVSPEVVIAQPLPITCSDPTVTLDGSNSVSGPGITYQWTASDLNCIIGDINAPVVNVSCPGIYTLLVFQDIGLQTCIGMLEVVVQEYTVIPTATVAAPSELSCSIPCTTLDASLSDNDPPFISGWTGPNGFISDELNPTVCEPGNYLLTITNEENGCFDTMSVVVLLDDATPFADAGMDVLINCQNESIILDGSYSSQGPDFLLQWEDENNVILGTTQSLEVNTPGTYILSVFNQTNGCVSTDEVIVAIDISPPIADIENTGMLDCATTSIFLDGSGSISMENYSFSWQYPIGTVIGTDTITEINTSGTYYLIINNLSNGCSDTTSTFIIENTTAPLSDAGSDQSIDCVSSFSVFDGSNSSGEGNLGYQWLDETNVIIGTDTTLQVSNPGSYFLIVTDLNNSCTDTSSVVLNSNALFPVADAGLDTLLNCTNPVINLSAGASDSGSFIEYEWQDENGNILGTEVTLPTDSTGVYTLFVTDTENGCSSSDEITINENFTPPSSDAGVDVILDCTSNSVTLDGSGSQQGVNITYQWEDGNNNPIGSGITFEVNSADIYTLVVTDNQNGCNSSSTVEVTQEIDAPIADAGADLILNCNATNVILDGGNSSSGPNIITTWSNETGDLLGNNLQLQTTLPGIYSLSVFNSLNGCTSVSNTVVTIDTISPLINVSPDKVLNCYFPEATIGESLSSTNPDWTFAWQDEAGNTLSNTDTLQVSSPGIYSLMVTNTVNTCETVVSTIITEDFTLPISDAGNNDTLTCVIIDILLDGSNSDTGLNYLLEWQNSQNELLGQTESITVSEPGLYLLRVTNLTNGCTASDEVVVSIDTLAPIVNAGQGDTLTCTTTSITLDASNSVFGTNVIFSWTNDSNISIGSNLSQAINEPGTYNFAILNTDNGCEASKSVTVLENTILPVADAGIDMELNCYSPSTILNADNSSSGSNFTYEWQDVIMQPISNQISFPVSTAQIYTLLVTNTDNGCMSSDEIDITADFNTPVSDAGVDILLDCQTMEIILGGSNTSTGVNLVYQWNNSAGEVISTNINHPINEQGIFEFIVFDNSNGCSDTSFVEVTVDQEIPLVTGVVDELLTCVQLTTTLNGTGSATGADYNYNWTTLLGTGLISPGNDALTPFVSLPGVYQLIITNNINQCADSITFTVEQDIEAPHANAGQAFELNCHAPVSNLDGSLSSPAGILEFNWSTSNGQFESPTDVSQPTIALPGDYFLTVLNTQNGCMDTDQVEISSNFITGLEIEIQDPLCFDQSGNISIPLVSGGSPPFLYSIDGGEQFYQNNLFSNVPAGSYDVVIQDSNECEWEEVAQIYAPAEVLITLDSEVEILMGESYQLYAITNLAAQQIDTILWSPTDSLSCLDCLNPIASPLFTTDYRVQVIDNNGCSAEALQRVNVDRRPNIYVPNVFSPNGDGNNDIFMIFSNFKSVAQVKSFQIFNRWGEPVFEAFGFPTNDATYGWDGKFRGKQSNSAVFVWFAEIEFVDKRVELFKGDVVLVK